MPDASHDDVRDKRHAILHAARELFAAQGYDATTIAQIARAAGIAVGTVYLYFANKRDIRLEVGMQLDADMAQVIRSHAIQAVPFRQVPRAIVEATFHSARENMRLMTYYQVEPQSPAEADRLRASQQGLVDALDAYLRRVIAQGQMPQFDTAIYANLLVDLVGGTVRHCFALEHGEREAVTREGLIELIERLFFGPPLADGGAGAARDSAFPSAAETP